MTNDEILLSIQHWFKALMKDCIKEEMTVACPLPPIIEPEKQLRTETDAQEFFQVSKVTLSKWRREGKLKFSRAGTRIRYRQSDLEDFLSTNKKYGRSAK